MTRNHAKHPYAHYVNPGLVELLKALDYGRDFVRTRGMRLYDAEGREYLDFLAGFGVHNIGHNHPRLLAALQNALAAEAPSMLNIDAPECQARLAEALNRHTHPELCRAFFANSGAEAVELAIKTVRAATGRKTILACQGAYHGLTTGALALTDAPRLRAPFGVLLPGVITIPYGDLAALEEALDTLQPAAFFVEPLQAEGGIVIPPPDYLARAIALCRARGALVVVDEIQTGLGRTGSLFATPFAHALPDILLLGKALSGGIVPIAVGLALGDVWKKAYPGPEHATLNASTFAGGQLACAAASEVLAIVEEERLAAHAARAGACLVSRLREMAARHRIVRAVRGQGLLIGIELEPASGVMMRTVPAWAREGLYAQVVCALLLRDHGIIAQPCSLSPNVLRVEPPLIVSDGEIDTFVTALDQVLEACPSHGAALKAAFKKRVLGGVF